jgi:hypothetical protein
VVDPKFTVIDLENLKAVVGCFTINKIVIWYKKLRKCCELFGRLELKANSTFRYQLVAASKGKHCYAECPEAGGLQPHAAIYKYQDDTHSDQNPAKVSNCLSPKGQ